MLNNCQKAVAIILVLVLAMIANTGYAQNNKRTLRLHNFDFLNRQVTDSGNVWYGSGNIRLQIDSTYISSDSMVWLRDYDIIHFFGRVEAYDTAQFISAGKISYYHHDSVLTAKYNVVMVNRIDSVRTESEAAEYDMEAGVLYLDENPRLLLNYPDTANLVDILSSYLVFYSEDRSAEAVDSVVIVHKSTTATCGCAEYSHHNNNLTLRNEPYVIRDSSDIKGELITIDFSGGGVRQIDVFGDAEALFVESADTSTSQYAGDTKLTGKEIKFYFRNDEVRKITAMGEARSEYYPSPDDTTGAGKNFVSGDTLYVYIDDRRVKKVEIIGGAEGVYITEKESEEAESDSSMAIREDSLMTDTSGTAVAETAPDSVIVGDSLASLPTEDSILYKGHFLEYYADNKIIRITGDASVRQDRVSLDAERIDYDIPKRIVMAEARVDTVDSNVQVEPLMLKDGSEEILGSRLVFNVDTKKGKIEDATTQYEQAYYRGQDLYKEDEEVFFVENGRLTSCELDEPHFHFRSHRMKLIHNDRVIARPVTLYIESLPVMTIPYYVFPLKRGRHSGILQLKIGNFEQGNRYIGNIGYYWAASEYWDAQASLDFHENIGITLNGIFRYNKRYSFNGNLHASYSRDRREYAFSESRSDRWRIWGNHSQTLPYEVDFRASGQFVSDKNYSTDYSTDPDERRNRNIISKANFNKRFGKASLSLSFSHTNNLDTESKRSSLPIGSFTMPSFHPFGSGQEIDGKTVKKWYHQFYVGYRNSFGFESSESKVTETIEIDDTTELENERRTWKDYGYLDHSFSISSPQKLFKHLTVGPSLSLQETWYYILKSDQARAAGIPADRPYRRGAISAGINSNTDLYGTFNINKLGLLALRHVISPSASFGWSPEITTNDVIRSFTGRGGGGGKQKRISFGLTNLFQAKVKSGETEKKLDLLRVSSNLSYNFEAERRKFSDLNTSLSSTLIKNVSIRGSLRHGLYDENDELDWRSPSLESFSISTSFQARGSVADDYTRQGLEQELNRDSLAMLTGTGLDVDVSSPPMGAGSGDVSWNLNFSHYYNESRSFGSTVNKTHWAQFTFNVDLTSNWKVKYSQKYDFVRHESVEKVVDLYRKLHCWEGHFYWIPDGSRQGYYFKINVIAIPDIKAEKSESGLRGALFNR